MLGIRSDSRERGGLSGQARQRSNRITDCGIRRLPWPARRRAGDRRRAVERAADDHAVLRPTAGIVPAASQLDRRVITRTARPAGRRHRVRDQHEPVLHSQRDRQADDHRAGRHDRSDLDGRRARTAGADRRRPYGVGDAPGRTRGDHRIRHGRAQFDPDVGLGTAGSHAQRLAVAEHPGRPGRRDDGRRSAREQVRRHMREPRSCGGPPPGQRVVGAAGGHAAGDRAGRGDDDPPRRDDCRRLRAQPLDLRPQALTWRTPVPGAAGGLGRPGGDLDRRRGRPAPGGRLGVAAGLRR